MIREDYYGSKKPHVVVGYDTRFLSDRYAIEVARVMAGNNIKALLANSDAPTPAISFAVKHTGTVAGVMIAASHNAPRYNGVKLKAAYGGSATDEQGHRVETYLEENQDRARGPNLLDYEEGVKHGLIERFNPVPDYYDHIRELVDLSVFCEANPRVIHDPM